MTTDGYRNNAEVVAPILRRHNVPATFFVCTRHARPGTYLWFTQLRALESHFQGNGFHFHGEFIDMSPGKVGDSVKRLRTHLLSLRPHPHAMYEEIENHLPPIEDFVDDKNIRGRYAGMTEEQIAELAGDALFSVESHTADHPFLTYCTSAEAGEQITNNRVWIEKITGRTATVIAYPSGDYDERIVDICSRLGFKHGFAVIPKKLNRHAFEVPRVGVFSTSLNALAVKARYGHLIRRLGLRVG